MGILRAGLIGLPSTGKTTLFQLLTQGASGSSANRFGRIEAQMGVATVPDFRLDQLAEIYRPKKRTPATVTFVDIGGTTATRALVDVAAYREADTLLHVVRAFTASEIPHAEGTIDPARDTQAIEVELILADLAVAEKRLDRIQRDRKKTTSRDLDAEAALLEQCCKQLEAGLPIRSMELNKTETKTLRGFQFLSAKPLLLVNNVAQGLTVLFRQLMASLVTSLSSPSVKMNVARGQFLPVSVQVKLQVKSIPTLSEVLLEPKSSSMVAYFTEAQSPPAGTTEKFVLKARIT
jgi:ribosome-binding ATPase YchF (GTP1/OBG family)